jgi:hypothetical protein
MVDMNIIESKDEQIARLEKALRDVDAAVEDAMGEKLVGARALMSLRWARKLVHLAFGGVDD